MQYSITFRFYCLIPFIIFGKFSSVKCNWPHPLPLGTVEHSYTGRLYIELISYMYKEIICRMAKLRWEITSAREWRVRYLGAIQKVCHRPRGGGRSSKSSDKQWQWGGGSSQTVMSPLMRKLCESFPNYWFSVININYRIAFSLNLFFLTTKHSTLWRWRKVNSDEDEDKLVIFF